MVQRKDYSQLSQSTKDRYKNAYEKVIKRGITLNQIEKMNLSQFNKTFGTSITKQTSLKGRKRLYSQLKHHAIEITKEYLQKEGITSIDLIDAYKESTEKIFKIKFPTGTDVIRKPEKPERDTEQYGLYKITDTDTGKEYWIKYDSENSFNQQLDTLQNSGSTNLQNYEADFKGFYSYEGFITSEVQKEVSKIIEG